MTAVLHHARATAYATVCVVLTLIIAIGLTGPLFAQTQPAIKKRSGKPPVTADTPQTQARQIFFEAFEMLRAGIYAEAAAKFEKGLALDPTNAVAQFYLGEAHFVLYDMGKAKAAYQAALSADPDAPEAAYARKRLAALDAPKPVGSVFRDCSHCPEMVVLPAGSFVMGSPLTEAERSADEGPARVVRVERFALGKTEVTQGQWRLVMGSNPSHFSGCGDDCPVERVNWDDAQAFVRKLNEKTAKVYRLPSEAEWEYACRAGGVHKYCGGGSIDDVAWYEGNSRGTTQTVAGKQRNSWGLYDMSGNVWEWTEDCWNDSYSGAPSDSGAWMSGDCGRRVLRGGSWVNGQQGPRSARRIGGVSAIRDDFSGFRLARMLP